jgi:hypothetical protein
MSMFSKTRTKRKIPEERRYANAMLMKESLRRLTGKESDAEKLQSQRSGLAALRDVDIERSGERRALGEAGIEDPGAYGRAVEKGEGALGSLMAADTEAAINRRKGATPLLGTLLRENQPFTKTRTKTGFMAKAAPYVKMGGKIAGGIVGGIYGGAAGAKMGSEMGGKPGEAMGDADKEAAAGSTSYSGGGGAPTGGTSGGPPVASTQDDTQLMTRKKNTGGAQGLMGLTTMFGGGATGG